MAAKLTQETRLFINNEFVDAKSGKKFKSVNPATEEVICEVHEAGAEDINAAVAAAKTAFKTWRKTASCARRDMLLKLADLVEKHRDQLAELESLDNGKPKHIADGVDIGFVIECYRYYAGWADKCNSGKVIDATRDSGTTFCYTRHEPIGVCGMIIPWNFPLLMQAWKLAPALAMGCTMVMKLSEKTPLSGMMMCQLIKEAGFPAGVVNVVNGPGTVGDLIARHMDISKVAFTGSSAVGHKIVIAAGESNLKKVTLELGGKSPLIICNDADLDQAAVAAHVGLFINMGQCCCASSRIFVHQDVHDAFLAKVTDHAKKLRTQGDTTSDTTVPICDLGPQVDKIQFDKVLGYIEAGKAEGAKVAIGGGRNGEKGYHVQPTIFTDVTDNMKIAKEEIFGPVMQVLKFKTLAEAVERCNNTCYGLAAGICTRDVGTALSTANDLEAGTVWINCYDNFDMACPFGGFKTSGWGREKGEYALENYTQVKCVMMPLDPKHP
jgi:aldehyde dehydrogenase (NAD+)